MTPIHDAISREGIVNALGLMAAKPYVGISGDPSLRETAMQRHFYGSATDRLLTILMPQLRELVGNRSSYRISIGFNNNVVRTASVFDPFREEVHRVEDLCDPVYVDRHFPVVGYREKAAVIRRIHAAIDHVSVRRHLPRHWSPLIRRRNADWSMVDRQDAECVVGSLRLLRQIPNYYLRSLTLCLVAGLVTLAFNCDGTQIVRASAYREFLAENGVGMNDF